MAATGLSFRVLGSRTPRAHVRRLTGILVESRSSRPWRYSPKLLGVYFSEMLPFLLADADHRVIGLFKSGKPIGVYAVARFIRGSEERAKLAPVMARINARLKAARVKASLETKLTPDKIAGLLERRGVPVAEACYLKALAVAKPRRGRRLGELLSDEAMRFARFELDKKLGKNWAVASTHKKSRAYELLKAVGEEICSGLIDGRKQSVFLIDLRKAVKD